ncbi:MAG: hypothetical protein AB2826_24270 [Candidatus Thiodiazotropha sp.]
MDNKNLDAIGNTLEKAKSAAVEYYRLTGKPLGITGEYGEYIAAKQLDLHLSEARMAGYDALDRDGRKIQIKSRSIPKNKKLTGQRLGSIRLDHEWDVVLLVIMDEMFEPQAMYEAQRYAIEKALTAPGSKARNERGALAISKFISLGVKVWPQE